ncbi:MULTISPECIES: phosphatase PAP2 family protein [Alicyclobacillus]|uniref:PAP2 superfamily protein n=1 Tax=Alicyclobacillus tolerans TaxID=90970 RepID=A0A1M6R0L0_9BACL|nr:MULTISPECIES: phosphatase PAP2 family protein [Alicyclobacillus]SHK26059.1 PAP2 superfamily protein [Alicyclobacillus montanus]
MVQTNFPLPYGFAWQYRWIVAIQSHASPHLDSLARMLSWLGLEPFYLLLLPVLYWSVNRKFGMRMAYVFVLGMAVNSWLKTSFGWVRPIGVPGIRSGYTSSIGDAIYSMPSGHAQGTMMFWTLLGRWFKRKVLWAIGILLVALIGWSRVYLGLHWPLDVIVGWALGFFLAYVGWSIGTWWSYREVPFSWKWTAAVVLPLVLLSFQQTASGQQYCGFLLGMGVGAVLEERFVGSVSGKSIWQRVAASIIGMAGLIGVQWGMKSVIAHVAWSTGVGLVAQTTAMGLFATFVAPLLFQLAGIYASRNQTTA